MGEKSLDLQAGYDSFLAEQLSNYADNLSFLKLVGMGVFCPDTSAC